MHEVTTRTIARTAFGLLCAAPTAVVLSWIVVTWTPWHGNRMRAAAEAFASDRTGLIVAIDRYDHPSPHLWTLQGVGLSDPETGRPVADIRRLEIRRYGGRINLQASQPTLAAESIDCWWRLIHDAGLCHRDAAATEVSLDARDVTIGGTERSHSFAEVSGSIQPVGDRVDAQLRLRPAGLEIDHPGIELSVVRDRSGARPTTSLRCGTGDLDISLAAIADRWPSLRSLGSAATFGGTVCVGGLTRTGDVSAADLEFQNVRVAGIELARLSERQSYRVSGTAAVSIQTGRLGRDGSVDFVGEATANDGVFDHALLPLLEEHLGCQIHHTHANDFRYDRLAVRFNLFASQLELTGICQSVGGRAAEVALVSDGFPIVSTRPAILPSAALASLLAPPHSVWVPVSRQTTGLLSLLGAPSSPLPPPAGSTVGDAAAPRVRVGGLQTGRR